MSWRVALRAEIAGSGYERAAEMPAPDAIDNDAGGQRGGLADNLLGQLQAARAGAEGLRRGGREDGEEAARNYFAGPLHIAADEYGKVARDAGAQVDPGDCGVAAIDPDAGVDYGVR